MTDPDHQGRDSLPCDLSQTQEKGRCYHVFYRMLEVLEEMQELLDGERGRKDSNSKSLLVGLPRGMGYRFLLDT